jgi:hypothetical protein
MTHKYDVGQLVSFTKPGTIEKHDFGVIIKTYIDALEKTSRYTILWQSDKQITSRYTDEEIQDMVSHYNLWDLRNVQNI